MDAATRQFVRTRAADRCEYCRLPQSSAPYLTFHIEHIHAQQHVMDDSLENLALACPDYNQFKGPNLTTLDVESRQIVPLFHPRNDRWDDHFCYQNAANIGLTLVGKVTIRLLHMNDEARLEMRRELQAAGENIERR